MLKLAVAILLAGPQSPGLTVHEWGTFTSVAGESGDPQTWMPLSGPSDLPCFVVHLGGRNLKLETPSTVRMETPVLYFYAPRKMTLSVHVDFPKGWITEWYPQATRVQPEVAGPVANGGFVPRVGKGQIEWDPVEVTPEVSPELPTGQGVSHYYAARNTDAASIRVRQQQEKLIFYRGIATFSIPLRARMDGDRTLDVSNTGTDAFPLVILFENRGGRVGYRVVPELLGSARIDLPELNGDLEQLKREMADTMVAQGLYRKEALAMIETWRDSWFEEGTRIFYIAPRPLVDSVLPLTIKPVPTEIKRVFVGRVEVLSPFTREMLTTALSSGDIAVLEKFGRFLQPFSAQIHGVVTSRRASALLSTKYSEIQRQFDSPACVR
jgi:hypothetical protein